MWAKIVLQLAGEVVLPWLMSYLKGKKNKKLEKVVDVAMTGIEIAETIRKAKQDTNLTEAEKIKLVKVAVRDGAEALGVNDILQKKADAIKVELKAKIQEKTDKFISKFVTK